MTVTLEPQVAENVRAVGAMMAGREPNMLWRDTRHERTLTSSPVHHTALHIDDDRRAFEIRVEHPHGCNCAW